VSRDLAIGLALALPAGLHKMLMASVLVNDDFMHQTYTRQLIAGEWPVRDFFDYGMGLMYALGAAAQWLFGYRLLSEAILIGAGAAAATWLVYELARRATGSRPVAVIAALVVLVAAPRGYAYPKLVVYAVSASLWWWYVWGPSRRRAAVLGLWAAVAFYWRPDHGAYVAAGVILAMIAAHGLRLEMVRRTAAAGAASIVCVLPYLLYASVHGGGVGPFLQSWVTAALEEHRVGQEVPRWPLRRSSDVIAIEPASAYAPEIGIRWTRESSEGERRAILDRYGLDVVSTRDSESQRVRLSERAVGELKAVLSEPAVEDTDGVDRGPARLPETTWPALERWRFSHWWLRVKLLPGLDQPRAGEAAAILVFLVPMAALLMALSPLSTHLPARVPPAAFVCFGLFGLIVDLGLVRTPFHVRAVEAVVLPAIMLGILTAALLRLAAARAGWRRWLPRAVAALFLLLVVETLAMAGQSTERVTWVAGNWESLDRSRAAWEEVTERLGTSPPIDYWRNRHPELTLQFAAYARECVPSTDRILVRWFAPEVYYYSDRLMASRHLFFLPAFSRLPVEQRAELEKFRRSPPRLIFDRVFDTAADEAFPDVRDLIARDYRVVATAEEAGERYEILARVGDRPVRPFRVSGWPCYQ
jgi:hypothetical protein